MAAKSEAAQTLANWRAWVERACARGPAEAARCARFLDTLPDKHPALKGVAPDLRVQWADRLRAASKGA